MAFVLGAFVATQGLSAADPAQVPTICISSVEQANVVVVAHIRSGFNCVMLETRPDVADGQWVNHVSGEVNGGEGMVVFSAPSPGPNAIYRIRAGQETPAPSASFSGPTHFSITYGLDSCLFTEEERVGHVLNRLAYGPNDYELQRIADVGLEAWLDEQLNPQTIDESTNDDLNTRLDDLFYSFQPASESELVRSGEEVRYFKGNIEPPADWMTPGFDDATWLAGFTGIGYGDNDDETELEDMRQIDGVQPGYTTVYLRKTFDVPDPQGFDSLLLRINFDDGFVAYLNGTEVVRTNFDGTPSHDSTANANHEAGSPEDFDITSALGSLNASGNVLAIVGLNVQPQSSDFSLDPEIVGRQSMAGLPLQTRIRGVDELQQLVHLRGVYSRRQLQAVLGEFWENHFTTDFDKVRDYFDELNDSDGSDAMSYQQAGLDAAHAEHGEHEFFYQNALGHFGDLLLFSATSPAQLIYLDNVLNVKGAANENYAREILELFGFGVDNRYTQADIEELARCFTGWTVRKVWPDEAPTFPDSARNPPTDVSVQFSDTLIVDEGAGWKFFRGVVEPSPDGGVPSTLWTEPLYDDAAWEIGSTPIGYGDVGYGTSGYYGTVLTDMRQSGGEPGYLTVYLRRAFTIADPALLKNLVLSVKADDGFVAYLNGVEVARTDNMENTGTPPSFDRTTNGGGREPVQDQDFSLREFQHLLLPAPSQNVLAIQLHNISLTSSDAAMAPRVVERTLLPGSIENGDPNGVWTFRFSPDEHDTNPKQLFPGSPYEINLPGGRTGLDGVNDAIDVVDAMESHPSTAEFICVKLVNKFVSDGISLGSYHDRTAPAELLTLMDEAIAAWNTEVNGRKGHIGTVLQVLIDPISRVGVFWGDAGFKTKIKTPIEYINSTLRAINSQVAADSDLPSYNDELGMHLFTRDDPDGWSEVGLDWMDSGTLLRRVEFSRMVAGNGNGDFQWNTSVWIAENGFTSALDIVSHFNHRLFQGTLGQEAIDLLVEYGDSTESGASPLDPANAAHRDRVEDLVGLILSVPHWQYQ